MNDTYLAAWNTSPPSRLYALRDFQRPREILRVILQSTLARDELSECISNEESTEQVAEKREILRCINWFLDELPETERKMFVCRYWYLESVQQIADRYGFSLSKTASMLRRTRAKLRKQLKKEGLQ